MNQKLEANTLKVIANNHGYQVKGDVKINGQQASLDYRKPTEGDADIKLPATLDDASRARLGLDLGPAVSGSIPMKPWQDRQRRTTARRHRGRSDLGQARQHPAGLGEAARQIRQGHLQGGEEGPVDPVRGHRHRWRRRLDQGLARSRPERRPLECELPDLFAFGRRQGLAEVDAAGRRGQGFDARRRVRRPRLPEIGDLGQGDDAKSKTKNIDFDLDVKLGAVAGFNGEALRSVDARFRGATARSSFTLNGKIGRDTPLTADLRGSAQGQPRVIYLETNDAGAFFRFTDTYSKVSVARSRSRWSRRGRAPRQGRPDQRPRFPGQGRGALDRVAAGGPVGRQNGVAFSRLRAEFTRQTASSRSATAWSRGRRRRHYRRQIDYAGNPVRMSGTFVPMYGLNNIFGQIPFVRHLSRRRQQ